MTEPIQTFFGKYRFLSNFWRCEFVWDNIVWSCSEAAYVAAKTSDRNLRLEIANMSKPGDIKRFGRTIALRVDWDEVKVDTMREIVYAKFTQNADLKEKLLTTDDAVLEEGNTWGDRFWGVCPPGSGNGQNWLGKILMEVREELKG